MSNYYYCPYSFGVSVTISTFWGCNKSFFFAPLIDLPIIWAIPAWIHAIGIDINSSIRFFIKNNKSLIGFHIEKVISNGNISIDRLTKCLILRQNVSSNTWCSNAYCLLNWILFNFGIAGFGLWFCALRYIQDLVWICVYS